MNGQSNDLYIAVSIAKKNFTKMLRENLLGLVWLFMAPLLYAVFFLLVKTSISGGGLSSAELRISGFNAFIGLLLIQLWFQIIQETANIIRKNKNPLRSLNVSTVPFVMAILIESIAYLLIRIVIIAFAMLFLNVDIALSRDNILAILVVPICYIASSIFIGLLLAPWATLFSDIRSFLSSSLMPVALLSPIFYFPVNESGSFLYWVNHIIPFATMQSVVSDILFKGNTIYLLPVVVWLLVSVFGILILAALLKQQAPILLERLGN